MQTIDKIYCKLKIILLTPKIAFRKIFIKNPRSRFAIVSNPIFYGFIKSESKFSVTCVKNDIDSFHVSVAPSNM